MPDSSLKDDGLTEQEVGVTQPDAVRLTKAAPEAAVTRGGTPGPGVQVGADRPPGSRDPICGESQRSARAAPGSCSCLKSYAPSSLPDLEDPKAKDTFLQ